MNLNRVSRFLYFKGWTIMEMLSFDGAPHELDFNLIQSCKLVANLIAEKTQGKQLNRSMLEYEAAWRLSRGPDVQRILYWSKVSRRRWADLWLSYWDAVSAMMSEAANLLRDEARAREKTDARAACSIVELQPFIEPAEGIDPAKIVATLAARGYTTIGLVIVVREAHGDVGSPVKDVSDAEWDAVCKALNRLPAVPPGN
jgi:hypothetical protein